MNLVYLKTYVAIINKGSFSAAAESLGVSKGLVSRHVAYLEQHLGVKLLHRTTRVIRMSEAGEKLYLQGQKIFSLADNVEQDIFDMSQEASGLLRFTAPISIGDRIIQDILPRYKQACPNVKLELNFSNTAFDLASGENDIALRSFDILPELVVAHSLGSIRNVLVASPEYLFHKDHIQKLEDLTAHKCILNSHQQSWNVWKCYLKEEMPATASTIVVSGDIATSKYATAKILALQGEGIASLPWYSVDTLVAKKQLQVVLPQYQLFVHEMAIIHAAQRQLPQKLKIFKTLLTQWFLDHPEYIGTNMRGV